jgi:hypothetical protein
MYVIGRKTRGKETIGRQRHRWVYNTKLDFVETGWDGVDGLVWFRIETGGELL